MEYIESLLDKKHRKKRELIALSQQQEEELLSIAYSKNYKHGLILEIALNTSLRVNELTNLLISDLYLKGKEPFLSIHDHVATNDHADFKCKTELSNRQNALDTKLAKKLRDFIGNRKMGYLFESNRGSDGFKHYNKRSLINLINKYTKICKSINIRNGCIGFHTTRRTYASKLLDRNVPINQISLALGHADISTTIRYLKPIRKQDLNLIRRAISSKTIK